MSLPTHTDEWVLSGTSKTEWTLRLNKSVPLEAVGENEVLVAVQAVGLNYRDIAIARGDYPLAVTFPLVPVCDMAGKVLAVGASVTSLFVGDAVCAVPAPLFLDGHLTRATHLTPGDGKLAGYLRRHAVVPAAWLTRALAYLTPVERAATGGAAVTAWNILFGDPSQPITDRSWVLVQGTGAVSLFAAAFSHRVGATIVATTSSATKEQWLRDRQVDLGAHHIINYRTDPRWGASARALSPNGGEGLDLVVDVGGAGTLAQSLEAVRYDGTVAVTGFLSTSGLDGLQNDAGPPIMAVLPRAARVRGILAGSRAQFEAMLRQMEVWQMRPFVDEHVFDFAEAKEAFAHLEGQKHMGKVVINVI